jgi:hypothetical protein
MFRYRNLFLFHFVRKYRFERDVADALYFEVKAFEVWLATDGDEHNIGFGLMESRAKHELKATHLSCFLSFAASIDENLPYYSAERALVSCQCST